MVKIFSFLGAILFSLSVLTGSAAAQGQGAGTAPGFRISRVAMAITKVDAMVGFYRSVFNIDFKAVDIGNGVTLYTGKFSGIDILFAPNEIANVKAEQSRTQFDIIVPNIKEAKEKAQANGGSVREENEEPSRYTATLVDPDGNTVLVIQMK